jgi:hypothetical protein
MGDHIFICYARKDARFVLRLAARLKARGVPVWLDQWDIKGGMDWEQSVDSALHNCAQFLIVLSPVAVASNEVRGELRTALDKKKPIVPVLHQSCEIPRQLRLIQYIDFSGCGPDDVATLDRLVRALGIPDEGHLLQREHPMPKTWGRRWLYGPVAGLLGLGLLISWLVLPPISPSQPDQPVNPPLSLPVPRTARVYVGSQPTGAEVWQDGQRVDTTPWQFDAPVGSAIRAILKSEGYKDKSIEFQVNAYENKATYRLEKSGRR